MASDHEIAIQVALAAKDAMQGLAAITGSLKEMAVAAKKEMEIRLEMSKGLGGLKNAQNMILELKRAAEKKVEMLLSVKEAERDIDAVRKAVIDLHKLTLQETEIGVRIDDAELKKAEKALQESQAQIEAIANTISGGLNSAFSGITGVLTSVGGSILSFLNPLNLIPNAFGLISGAASLVSGAFSGFMGILSTVGSAITTMIVTPFQLAWGVFTTGIDIVSSLGSGFMNLIFNIGNIGQAINTVLTFIQPLIDALGFIKDKFLDIINTTTEFESGMSKVGSVANASAAEMEMLRQAAIRIGADTPLSASQATEALYALASGGMKAKEAIAALEGVAMLATASQANLGDTAQIVSTSLSAFKMSADEAARVANVYSAACNESQLNVTRLGDSMKYIGPVAGQLKMNFEETTAALALMSNAGIMGEQAGTALRAAIGNLIAPSRMQTDIMAELGLTMEDLNPKTQSLAQILDVLKSKNIDAGQAFRLFGESAGPGMMALLDQGGAALTAMQTKLTGTQSAYTTAAMQMDNFKAAQEQLSGAYESLSITIGGVFTGALKSMTMVLSDVISGFTEFLNQSGLINAATVVISGTFSGIKEILFTFSPIISSVTNGFALLFSKMSEGVIAFVNFIKNSDIVQSGLKDISGIVTSMSATFNSFLKDAFGLGNSMGFVSNSTEKAGSVFAPLQSMFSGVGTAVSAVTKNFIPLSDVVTVAMDATDTAGKSAQELAADYETIAGADFERFGNGIVMLKDPIDMAAAGVKAMAQNNTENAASMTNFSGAVSAATVNTNQYIKTLSAIPKISIPKIGTPGQLMSTTASAAPPPPIINPADVNLATPDRIALVELLKTSMSSLKDIIKTVASSLIEVSKAAINFTTNFMQIGTVSQGTTGYIDSLTKVIKILTPSIVETISSMTNMAVSFLNSKALIDTLKSSVNLFFEGLKALNGFLLTITQSFILFIAQLTGGTVNVKSFDSVMNTLKITIQNLQTGFVASLGSMSAWIGTFVGSGAAIQTFQTVLNATVTVLGVAKEGAVLFGTAVAVAFALLPTALNAVVPVMTTVGETFKNMMANLAAGNISGVFASLATGIKTGLTQVIDTLKTNGTQITDFFVKMWDGLKEAWDKTLSPLLKDLFDKLITFITEQGPGLLKTVSDLLTGIFKSAGETVNQMLPELFKGLSNIGQSLQDTGGAMSEVAKSIMAPIAEALKQGITALKLIITEGFKAVGEVAKGSIIQLVEILKTELANSALSEGMKEQFSKMFNDIQTAIRENKLGEAMKTAFDALILAFDQVKPQLQTAFDGIAELIKNSILKALGTAYENAKTYILTNFGNGIGAAFGTAMGIIVAGIGAKMLLIDGSLAAGFAKIIAGVPGWLAGFAPSVAGVFSSIGTAITTALAGVSIAAIGAVMLLGAGIGQAFISMGYEWVGYIATVLVTAVGAFVLGIAAWPAVIIGALAAVGLAFYNWLIGNSLIEDLPMWWGQVFDAMITFFNEMTQPISDAFMAIWNFVAEAVTAVTQTATDIGTAIIDAIIAVFNGAVELVSTAFNAVWTFLADVVTFVTDGATQIANGLIDTITTIITAGASLIKSAFEAIWTFLTDVGAAIADIGKSIGEGLINAIQGAIEVGKSVIESVVNGIVSIAQGAYDRVMSIVNAAKAIASAPINAIANVASSAGEFVGAAGFADGGIIKASRGGSLVTMAEAGMNEAAVPLPDGRSIPVSFPNMPDFAGLAAAANGGGGNVSINFGDVIIRNGQDEREFFNKIERTITDVMRRTRGR